MYVEILKKTNLMENKRCHRFNLFTTGHSVEQIRKLKGEGRKIVCLGVSSWSYLSFIALREVGIGPDIISDERLKTLDVYLDDIPICQREDLLKAMEKYYFIITLGDAKVIEQIRKQFLLLCVKDFAILTLDWVFDLDQCFFKDVYLRTFNKVYKNIDFSENNFSEARTQFSNSPMWWNGAVDWMLTNYNNRENISLLDTGPGSGVPSLIYKELFGVSLTWINLEEPPSRYKTPSYQQDIIENEKINVQYGYLGVDDFYGTYDIILFTEILEHLTYNPVIVMKRLYDMLKPNGYLILTTPCKQGNGLPYFRDWRDLPSPTSHQNNNCMGESYGKYMLRVTMADHVYYYTPEELDEILAESNFKIVFRKIGGSDSSGLLFICTKDGEQL